MWWLMYCSSSVFYRIFPLKARDRMRPRSTKCRCDAFEYIVVCQEAAEDDWYNKSLSALRMNPHPSFANSMLSYQA